MTTSTPTSVLETLGYQVMSLEGGVYLLQNRKHPDEPQAVALLLTPHPLVTPSLPVKLFVQPVPAGVAARDIVDLWHDLDARRFEETGLVGAELELGPLTADELQQQAFERPGGGKRIAISLPSQDVVCFN
ncbi:hypothetical protein [Burkholderia ubonensis]|uniref:hypothetical protein n=1 Tax=Burkholderia ubonensis TaxID=101571 RepID=UPI000B1B4876|nr:hypothetical protein [Burkholderia ubonensis]